MSADVAARVADLLDRFPPSATAEEKFWAAQFDAGLAWVDFPEGLGGLGIDYSHQEFVDSALAAAGAPRNEPRNLIGLQMMAPTLIAFGNEAQLQRYLRRAFICDDLWCQLFSEPGAGSDLASLTTRAERDGDHWIVNGQKVWTTLAHMADYGLLLARTDPSVPKHAGLSYFVLDMHATGVDVRPLRQITGEAEYNEVFLTDVVVPDANRIGEVGQGWKAAMATLMSERGVVGAMSKGTAMAGLRRRVLDAWVSAASHQRHAANRDRVMRTLVELDVLRLTAERADVLRRHGRPGPEGSITKSAFGIASQRALSLCMDLHGPSAGLIDHYDQLQPDRFTHVGGDQDDSAVLSKAFLASQALTIAGGTTNVNKNVLGERVLGLPAEPRPDRTTLAAQGAKP